MTWPLALLVAAPWLVPFVPPPSTYGLPWLATILFASLWLLILGNTSPRRTAVECGWAQGLLIAGMTSAVIGLGQYTGAAALWSEASHGWINAGHIGEAYGHLRQRNLFATLTNIALAASVYLLWQRPRPWSVGQLLAWWGCAIVLLAANVASASRTGLVQLVLAVVVVVLMGLFRRAPRLLVHLALSCMAIYAICLWVVPALLGQPNVVTALGRMSESHVCENRAVLWFNVMELITQRPWFGWGWGELDWAHHMAEYRWTAFGGPHRFCFLLDNAHNLLLHVAVEGGLLVCGLLVAALMGLLAWRKPWKERRPHVILAWAIFLLVMFHSMLEYPLWYGPFVMVTAISLVLILLPEQPLEPGTVRRWTASLATLLLAFFVWTAYDYARISQYFLPREQRLSWIDTPALSEAAPSFLFQSQLDFARLITMNVTQDNASDALELAQRVMHYSPEPRVIEQLMLAALWERNLPLIALHEARYRQAYPDAYRQWLVRRVVIQSTLDARR